MTSAEMARVAAFGNQLQRPALAEKRTSRLRVGAAGKLGQPPTSKAIRPSARTHYGLHKGVRLIGAPFNVGGGLGDRSKEFKQCQLHKLEEGQIAQCPD